MAYIRSVNSKTTSDKPFPIKIDPETKKIQISKVNSIIDDCKEDWEIARMKKGDKDKRDETIKRIFHKIEGHIAAILKKRTGSKMLQTIFKFGTHEIKDKIFDEIRGDISGLTNCSFSIFFLQKLLYTKYFQEIITILVDNHKKIITDRVGAFYLDEAYQKLKKGPQKDFLKNFLGNKAQLFYSNTKIMDIPAKEFDFEHIMRKMLDKGLTNLTIGHDLLHLHLSHFEDPEERKLYLNGLLEFFVDFVHTINGRKITIELLEDSNNHKIIIKQVSEHLMDFLSSEKSLEILFLLLAKIEQKEIQKYVLKPIKQNMETFLKNLNFHIFISKLIEIEKFDYLKEKFLKLVLQKNATLDENLRKIVEDLQIQ